MKTTKQLLEEDKESFISRLSASKDMMVQIRTAEEEIGKIQIRYAEEEGNDNKAEWTGIAFAAAKAAVGLIDSQGEVSVFSRTLPDDNSSVFFREKLLIMMAGGSLLLVLGLLLMGLGKGISLFLPFLCLAFTAAGGYYLFRAGAISAQKPGEKTEQLIETSVDVQKVYHQIENLLTVIDQELDQTDTAGKCIGESIRVEMEEPPLPEDELRLLSALLQTVYFQKDQPYAKEMLSEIRFFLHRRQIEIEEYTDKNARLFDCLPSAKTATVRPALTQAGALLCKGLAAVEGETNRTSF